VTFVVGSIHEEEIRVRRKRFILANTMRAYMAQFFVVVFFCVYDCALFQVLSYFSTRLEQNNGGSLSVGEVNAIIKHSAVLFKKDRLKARNFHSTFINYLFSSFVFLLLE
jgi:hypothetical protein